MSIYNLYLGDVLRSIELIEDSKLDKKINYPLFIKDRNLFDATTIRLQIIGEYLNYAEEILKWVKKKI